MKLYECPKCGWKYQYPDTNSAGFTFWDCPSCGAEDGIHVSPAIDDMFSEEQLTEIKKKQKTYCNLRIVYTSVSDLPKFKKYMPELSSFGNQELIAKLRSDGGIVKSNISKWDADHIKALAESFGLEVEIYA
jgi:rubredoxin